MIRNLKALGLALGVVFVMGALSASSASAVTDIFTTQNQEPVIVTGVSTHPGPSGVGDVFKMTGSGKDFTCTTSRFSATVKNGDTHVTVTPEYTGKLNATPHGIPCNSSAGDVTIDMNGCDYDLTGTTTGHDPVGSVDATISITCPVNKKIEITAPAGVIVSVPAQTPGTGGVTYTNLPNHSGGSAITINSTATNVTYTCAPAFACGLGGIATHGADADYNGHTIITGWKDEAGGAEGPQRAISFS